MGKQWKQWQTLFFEGPQNHFSGECSHEIKRCLPFLKKHYDQPRQHIKKQRHYFATKGPSSQSYIFFTVVMYGCESWTLKKVEHQRSMLLNCAVGEDSWKSLGLQGEPTIPSKGYQSWIFIGRTDVEAQTAILWPPDEENWLIGKDPDARKDWRWEEKGTTDDEMFGWHHQLNGHEFE